MPSARAKAFIRLSPAVNPATDRPHRQLLRLPAVIERTGLSKTAVYMTPGFPRPVKLTAMASAWVASEIDEWIQSRMAARDAEQK
jgi:prophage regulatory protein